MRRKIDPTLHPAKSLRYVTASGGTRTLELENDESAPGASQVYGTDGSGVKGWQAAGGGGGAPTTAQYVTLATDATLTAERVLTAGTAIVLTDAGAGSTLTVAVDLGTTGTEACAGNDARLSDSRTPTAHQASHRVGGSDALPTGDASTPGLLKLGASGGAQAWDADLDGYAALGSTGIVARTGAGTVAARTIAADSPRVSVADGDGVSASPTIDASTLALPARQWVCVVNEATGLTTIGTGTAVNSTLTSATDATGLAVSVASTGTGVVGYWRLPAIFQSRWTHRHRTLVQMSADVSSQRVWVGAIAGTTGTTTDTMLSAGTCARYSTPAGETTWNLICHDGTTQAAAVDTGVTVSVDHLYLIDHYTDDAGTTHRLVVRDLTAATSGSAAQTSNVPAASTALRPAGWIVSSAAVTRTLIFRGHDGVLAALFAP